MKTNNICGMGLAVVCVLASCVFSLSAQTPVGLEKGARIRTFSAVRADSSVVVTMDFDLSSVNISSNKELVLKPVIRRDSDSLSMAPVIVAGRNRYYHFVRKNHPLDEAAMLCRNGERRDVTYRTVVPYRRWMAGARLYAEWTESGCCADPVTGRVELMRFKVEPKTFVPHYLYVQPPIVEKEDSAERTAHIIFIVNKTDINYKRQQNIDELDRIRRTIDSLKNDRDYTITSLTVKGYASPESPYDHNRYLAEGRTETLKRYIMQQHHFPSGLITTEAEPEDWAGLQKYVETSSLQNREEIMALIRMNIDPDKKELLIKRTFPQDYRFLLTNVYPDLRRSEYKVRYKIRVFSDIEEIKRALKTEPGKLNLYEIYQAAQTMQPGSEDFTEAFRIAAVMFPDDEIANLNAANAAMEHGEPGVAERYLEKAGNSSHARFARAMCTALSGRYEEAKVMFEAIVARTVGDETDEQVTEAVKALEQLNEIIENQQYI
ncbi:MAG: DUF3868 domain-containing protein [Clostridium sp.]|nr:DUF3868 domain-containing protein [Clostridium sp.]